MNPTRNGRMALGRFCIWKNLSSGASRHATIRSVIFTSSAAAINFFSQSRIRVSINAAKVRTLHNGKQLLVGPDRLQKSSPPLDHQQRHRRHRFLFQTRTEDVGIENDPLQTRCSTSFRACLILSSIPGEPAHVFPQARYQPESQILEQSRTSTTTRPA